MSDHTEPEPAEEPPPFDTELLHFVLGEIVENPTPAGVSLGWRRVDNKYVLTWTDFVANDWTEEYVDLSVALLRLACLARCEEDDWSPGFRDDATKFPDMADRAFGFLVI